MPFKVWQPKDPMNAVDVNPLLQAQVVAQFPDAATRAAQWTAPPVGAVSILADSRTLWSFNGTVWKLQSPQRGQPNWSCSGTNSATGTVTFPIPYAAPPIVLLTSQEGNFYDMVATVMTVTATNFTWRLAQKAAGNITGSGTFFWIALESTL